MADKIGKSMLAILAASAFWLALPETVNAASLRVGVSAADIATLDPARASNTQDMTIVLRSPRRLAGALLQNLSSFTPQLARPILLDQQCKKMFDI
ncbi:hypothetical protein [Bradyrhizobium sp. CCGUVB23]|uniref:hypothetical protein n=1 Tax=Bradyrhizobium sp. CCGUVB23 TaxID=2949630 RepID=UPI0020B26BC3|nr:hypothetical protein [Bradyrhizobium sp. CCGUVB23]MCP3463185.1 hypothetical protein [Bradyrhizobium sp. CCGUVB23]